MGIGGLRWAVALTGILALMPYIALQLVGMRVVIASMLSGAISDSVWLGLPVNEWALVAAFCDSGGLYVLERTAGASSDLRL